MEVERNLQTAKTEAAVAVTEVEQAPPPIQAATKDRVKISPVARKKWRRLLGLILSRFGELVQGGRITKEDVLKAIEEFARTVHEVKDEEQSNNRLSHHSDSMQRLPVTGMRRVIAERMQSSLQTSAQLTLTMKVDVTDLIAMQKQAAETVHTHYETKTYHNRFYCPRGCAFPAAA
ncbi:hypothetical protein GCM10020331_052530 [Ectobacillus funiculus]